MALIDSLIAYWKLDEISGNARDSHSSHDGIMQGDPTQNVTGKIDKAVLLDSVGDYIQVVDHAALSPAGAFSISMWVKTTDASLAGLFSKSQNPVREFEAILC